MNVIELSKSRSAVNADIVVPAGIWCQNDVILTSMRRNHVASTLIRRHFYVMCPLVDGYMQ